MPEAKRTIRVTGTDFELKPALEKKLEESYTEETVSITNNGIDGIVKVTGTVTGKQYVFNGAGDTQQVDIRDKDELLNKKRGRACCGGESYISIFVLTE